MKVKYLLITVISFICLVSCAAEKNNPLEGTWALISGKNTTASGTTEYSPGELGRVLKIINKTHFATVSQDTAKMGTYFNAGNYSFSEDIYTENIEFFSSDTELIGSTFSYKIKIEGDQFTLSGPLKKEGESEPEWQSVEIWKKIK
jgi:hypothetical protein